MDIIKWDKIEHQIAEAKDIQTLSNMSDKLEAIRVMAKQSKQSLEVQNRIAEYRLRVERKKGEWLQDNIEHNVSGRQGRLGLEDIGISKDDSSKSKRIAALSKKEFEEYIHDTKETNKEVTLAGAVKLAKEIIREEKIEEQKKEIKKDNIEQPKGEYDIIVVDPPWSYGTEKAYDPDGYRGTTPYPTMQQNELLKIDLPTKKDCILWLWTTNTHIRNAYELLEEWGFAPKSILTWDKVNIGMGRWLRSQTEHCILAVKGSPLWTNKRYSTLISEKRTTHSTKPEAFYKMVDDICVGRKLDYFARKKREGWDVFGDEVSND